MIPTWSQNDPKMIPKWFQNDPKMIPKWSQHDPKMIPNWSQKWSQHDPKMIPKWSQNNFKMIPKFVYYSPGDRAQKVIPGGAKTNESFWKFQNDVKKQFYVSLDSDLHLSQADKSFRETRGKRAPPRRPQYNIGLLLPIAPSTKLVRTRGPQHGRSRLLNEIPILPYSLGC